MALNDTEQFKTLLTNSRHALIVFASKNNGDAIASALALKKWCGRGNREAEIACSDFTAPANLKFLPGLTEIKPELAHLQKFIIKVDVSKAPIDTLSYDVKDNWLSIYLTPKAGTITKQELRTAQSTFKYDLIITLGAPDLDSLGSIFFNNTDLFYRTPIVNFDYQSGNERYGQVNIVDGTASAIAEVVAHTLHTLEPTSLNGEIATALLAGLTIATGSFKHARLSPLTMQLASDLVTAGAEREKIVQHLYRTRSVASLKLWGQALTHLQIDAELGLVSTLLTRDDFIHSGTTADDLHGIVEELLSTAPEAKLTLVLYEVNGGGTKKIHGILAVDKNFDATKLLAQLNPTGTKRQVSFILENMSLQEAEEKVKIIIKEAR
ncbi:MAG: hypothetical protein EXS55_00075 [Candidatus Magasanikbacteria bacterium]|nr:hypothetical protein [Candidatus Magasanikbacteria bacterium]